MQVRTPRQQMPGFPPAIVSDSQVRAIHQFLMDVPPRADRLHEPPPQGIQSPDSCITCHEKLNPVLVAQYRSSAMFRPERQNPRVPAYIPEANTCAACHGFDHTEITLVRGRVAETMCAVCHVEIYQEHVVGGGHSYGPGPGDIGINWDRNVKVPHYSQMPRKVMEVGCDACHNQAGATDAPYWDYAWWYGYAETLGHLTKIRDEAGRLRAERATATRTRFMLWTGPLMVLGVIGAVGVAWMVWTHRFRARRGGPHPWT